MYSHTVIFGVDLAAVEHMGYCCTQQASCQMLGPAVVPARGEVLEGGLHHKEVGTLRVDMLLCQAVHMAACLAQHKDLYFGEHMGLWGGHSQVVDRTSQPEPGKGPDQTWNTALYCAYPLHKDLLGQVPLRRARFFGLCAWYHSGEQADTGAGVILTSIAAR